jgi:hypothetical protein
MDHALHVDTTDDRQPISARNASSPPSSKGSLDIATAALIRKRASLAGEAEALDARLCQLRADLVHLDAAIRILCPDAAPELIRPRKPSRKSCNWFGRQELPRRLLASLREAEQSLSCLQLAKAVMVQKGMDAADQIALRRVAGMVKGMLHRQDRRTVERIGSGRDVRWRVAG